MCLYSITIEVLIPCVCIFIIFAYRKMHTLHQDLTVTKHVFTATQIAFSPKSLSQICGRLLLITNEICAYMMLSLCLAQLSHSLLSIIFACLSWKDMRAFFFYMQHIFSQCVFIMFYI